jgi:hypothetical protein
MVSSTFIKPFGNGEHPCPLETHIMITRNTCVKINSSRRPWQMAQAQKEQIVWPIPTSLQRYLNKSLDQQMKCKKIYTKTINDSMW